MVNWGNPCRICTSPACLLPGLPTPGLQCCARPLLGLLELPKTLSMPNIPSSALNPAPKKTEKVDNLSILWGERIVILPGNLAICPNRHKCSRGVTLVTLLRHSHVQARRILLRRDAPGPWPAGKGRCTCTSRTTAEPTIYKPFSA